MRVSTCWTLLTCVLSLVSAKDSSAQIARHPKIVSDWWQICETPDLGDLNGPNLKKQQIVDHGFIQDDQGEWQLWACIRGTAVSRLLYGWHGDSLEKGPWKPIGIVARAEKKHGEQVRIKEDKPVEKIGAPYFKKINDSYYCFYHSRGMRAMVSENGRNYQRADFGGDRGNLLYTYGGRDIMIAKFGDLYYSYSTVSLPGNASHVRLRTSKDLLEWSKPIKVSEGGRAGSGGVSAESPFVIQLDGYYYLFRSSSITSKTYVYRSTDPTDFGVNDDKYFIAEFKMKAPELIQHEGQWYISSLGDFQGIRLAKLEWALDK